MCIGDTATQVGLAQLLIQAYQGQCKTIVIKRKFVRGAVSQKYAFSVYEGVLQLNGSVACDFPPLFLYDSNPPGPPKHVKIFSNSILISPKYSII